MDILKTAELIEKGDLRHSARVMRSLDDGDPEALEVLKVLYPNTGRAWVLGITGSPGVGKSTLTDVLVTRFREQGKTVGVVAVDPTSPFTGGAILGDRIRMQRHATDDGVFIRSLATRGHFGGLTASTRGVVTVMDAMGKDVILVETVGVGQDEVDVAKMADTTLIVTVPGMGDDIQAIKAGILEVGDIFVVNKMDRPGGEATLSQLENMLMMEREGTRCPGWNPPVVPVSAANNQGLDDLLEAIKGHYDLLHENKAQLMNQRRRERAKMELMDLIQTRAKQVILKRLEAGHRLEDLALSIAKGEKDPYSVCQEVIEAAFSD
ncbi:methylmalonyl Co-A mutase-associated GTPase MeaB [Dethiosulfatarculus sandiegensis]|uniref:GTPase n=1 Tax=Dethiosulfatarculus sandiegensis TaxID=1429043 RepID=A0A0D2JQN8_9BACT|nr:methylmalonyl Co-A mutase-associated GTPase MeaB [Dethiosulfatarculus sandiegensis]KIX11820.1 GTPase [Dethiosulfatarculus sandiegensis]